MRTIIASAAILALLTAFLAPAAAQPATVKIAFLSSLSGPFAPWGVNARDGMKMGVAEVNAGGGILGRPMELVERDDRNSPAEAITAFRFLVEREGIVAAGGVISSDVALAAAREAETLRVPLFLTMAGSDAILARNSRYTFRTCLVAGPMYVQAIAEMVRYNRFGRVGAIVADYAWGHSIRQAFERYVNTIPGVRTQLEVAPVTVPDFTPFIRRLQGLDPQLVVAAGHPPGNPTIVRQMGELGLASALVIGSVLPPEVMVARAGDAVYGRFQDYSCVDFQNPTWARLAAKYRADYKRYFDNSAFSGYVTVKMVADAAKRANTTNPQAVAEAVRKGRFVQAGYGWPLSYTEWGEMKEARPIIFVIERGEAPGGANPGAGWWQKWWFRPTAVEPYVPPN